MSAPSLPAFEEFSYGNYTVIEDPPNTSTGCTVTFHFELPAELLPPRDHVRHRKGPWDMFEWESHPDPKGQRKPFVCRFLVHHNHAEDGMAFEEEFPAEYAFIPEPVRVAVLRYFRDGKTGPLHVISSGGSGAQEGQALAPEPYYGYYEITVRKGENHVLFAFDSPPGLDISTRRQRVEGPDGMFKICEVTDPRGEKLPFVLSVTVCPVANFNEIEFQEVFHRKESLSDPVRFAVLRYLKNGETGRFTINYYPDAPPLREGSKKASPPAAPVCPPPAPPSPLEAPAPGQEGAYALVRKRFDVRIAPLVSGFAKHPTARVISARVFRNGRYRIRLFLGDSLEESWAYFQDLTECVGRFFPRARLSADIGEFRGGSIDGGPSLRANLEGRLHSLRGAEDPVSALEDYTQSLEHRPLWPAP